MANYTAKERAYMQAEHELEYGRVDFRRVKLVPFPPKILNPFVYDTLLDARVAYVADMGNHCVRRIVVKLANVDTFAGICGEPGFKDGIYGSNKLDRPSLVATDHNGTVYIYDSGNKYIRIVDPATKFMKTMTHGSCRLDYLTNRP